MTEVDLLNDILTSNPNEPVAKGVVLLLRTEMKFEFKSVRLKLEQHDQRFDQVDQRLEQIKEDFVGVRRQITDMNSSLEMIAQQIAVLVARNA